jgi:hypothetical protein
MPSPTVGDVHQDKALQNVAVLAANNDYPAARLFGQVPVEKESDKYYVYDLGDTRRVVNQVRAMGTAASQLEWGLTTSTYNCVERAVAKYVPDRLVRNADAVIKPLASATRLITDALMLGLEERVSDFVTSTGNYASGHSETLAGANQWSDFNSTPLTAIRAKSSAVKTACGRRPNVFAVGDATWQDLLAHPDVSEVIKYTGAATPDNMLRALAESILVDEVILMDASETTSNPGQTDTFGNLWSDDAALLVRDNQPSLDSIQFGSWFVQNGQNFRVRRWRDDPSESTVVEVQVTDVVKLVSNVAGYLWKDTN